MTTHLRDPLRVAATLAVLLVSALGSVALGVQPAAAHASLVSSSPSDRSGVDRAPDAVELTFSEPIREPAFVTVSARGGADLAAGAVEVDGADVRRSIDAGDATGTITVAYRVVSADGHPIEGELSFEVRGAPEPEPSPEAAEDTGAPPATPDTDPAPTAADAEPAARTTSDDGSSTWVVVGIGVGVAVAVAVLLGVARRRGAS